MGFEWQSSRNVVGLREIVRLPKSHANHINTPEPKAFREVLAGDWIQFCWPKPSTVGG